MKKTLLLILLLAIFNNINAQVLLSEDFTSYTIGNIGTDFAGTNPGQGGWYTRTLVSSNGNNNNFQIVDVSGTNGKVLQITGYNGAAAVPSNSRFMDKSIATAYANRDFGSEITEVVYDFYTGPATTSGNIMRVAIYDSPITLATSKILAGILITMNPFTIRGVAYYDPVANGSTGAVGAYSFGMGQDGSTPPVFSEITLNANTWYKVGFSYNSTNGELKFRGAGMTRNTIQGAAVGATVDNVVIIGTTGGTAAAPNTASATGTFDNLVIKATATDGLLLANDTFLNNSLSISPNPADKYINVSNTDNINISEINITDLNGRIVKSQKISNVSNIEINVADLTTGMYLMNINTEKGIVTKKIMKN
jgi:Secretion system C-terminal sorting domain